VADRSINVENGEVLPPPPLSFIANAPN